MKYLLPVLLFLVSCSTVNQTQDTAPITTGSGVLTGDGSSVPAVNPTCPAVLPVGCPTKGTYQAVDISEPMKELLANQLKCSGIDTIIRYYDWPGHETIKGKIPLPGELLLIKKYGFKILFVFQHNNGNINTFKDSSRPAKDFDSISQIANVYGQPKGTGVYVGVDGDFGSKDEQVAVKNYFSALAPKLRGAGFRVGMYGGGASCVTLQAAKLIDLPCWIAASSWGWTGTKAALDTNNFGLKQKVNQTCMGQGMDYNTVNPKTPDVGQWSLQ